MGTDIETIVDTTFDLLDNRARYERMSQVKNPFGDGRASERIVKAIMFRYGLAQDRPEEFSAGE